MMKSSEVLGVAEGQSS